MMKTLLVMFVAFLMVIGFSMVGLAAQGQKATMGSHQTTMMPAKKMESKEKVVSFKGTVTEVDKTANTIMVKGKEGVRTFDVSKVTLGKVVPGEKVNVKYTTAGEKTVFAASSVTMIKPDLSNGAKEGVTNELGVKKEKM